METQECVHLRFQGTLVGVATISSYLMVDLVPIYIKLA